MHAVATAAAAAAKGEAQQVQQQVQQQQQQQQQQQVHVFAPRNFRFFDSARGKVLNVFFHNAFGTLLTLRCMLAQPHSPQIDPPSSVGCSVSHNRQTDALAPPFDRVACYELSESPSVCVEHPRCSMQEGQASKSPRCALSNAYLSLAASSLCHRAVESVESPSVQKEELQAVILDLMNELGVEPMPLMTALQEAGASNAESICELAKELAAEVLATERNMKQVEEEASSEVETSEESLLEELLQSSLGFIGGSASPLSPAGATLSGIETQDARIRIGVNGFGRIGRLVFRIASSRPDMAITHVNSSMSPEYLAYMLKFDSVHGRFPGTVEVQDGTLFVNGRKVYLTSSRDPKTIDWQASGTDFVCESTGAFCTLKDASLHVDRPGGARHVVISAPAKDEETPTLVVGVNAETAYTPEMRVVSCASCTTNGLAPLVKVIDSNFGLEEGLMTTVHAVTGTQRVVDMASAKDWRGGRAAGSNIIPSSTGAAKAVARCLPHMKGKLTGMAFRVPTLDVSVVDLTCRLKKSTSYEEIKAAVKAAAEGDMKGILGYTEEDVVSSDITGTECSTVFDANAGIMLNPNFVKLISWYDNEFSYSARLVDLIAIMAAKDGLVPQGTGLNRKPF
ncbi:uncharacterized protein LOC34623754 [Cyclospora cayetanensis]|uniref:Uncharacterized protein LOC34623754 n=1 Tax=Cyclospora cayetanensis TaxID=88456 RepID=A0A6P6RWL0_9EIME|nr:uncharacterized protein LOC34623754 [Cyclospora cayetanensis]